MPETSRPPPLRYYRPELDVLRFFAFFMVFLSHVVPGDISIFEKAHIPASLGHWLISMAAGGAFGVDLFFTLSSFLITTLLLRERQVYGSIEVGSFYVRRMLRIWPLYFAFLLLIAPGIRYVLPAQSMSLQYVLAFVMMSGNWACVLWGFPHDVSSPLWSVSVEEQFYLLWPIMLRRLADHLLPVALGLLILSSITRLYLTTHGAIHPQIWCNSLARLDPFACGALLALYEQRNSIALSASVRIVLVVSACTLFTVVGHYEDFAGMKPLITLPTVTVACGALLVSALGSRVKTHAAPLIRTFTYLGRISYGLYVFHSMFIMLLDIQSTSEPLARAIRTAAALIVTIGTAAVSYQFLERPFLRQKEKFARIESRPV